MLNSLLPQAAISRGVAVVESSAIAFADKAPMKAQIRKATARMKSPRFSSSSRLFLRVLNARQLNLVAIHPAFKRLGATSLRTWVASGSSLFLIYRTDGL